MTYSNCLTVAVGIIFKREGKIMDWATKLILVFILSVFLLFTVSYITVIALSEIIDFDKIIAKIKYKLNIRAERRAIKKSFNRIANRMRKY